MLASVSGSQLDIKCNYCNHSFHQDVQDTTLPYLDEFQEFENLTVQCPNCQVMETFNVNIPENDTDEPYESGELPLKEEIQRYYVRLLIRLVRADFKEVQP